MKKLIVGLILVSSNALATELQFQFKSPSFNGAGYSAHVLTIENLEATRRQKLVEDKKAEAIKAASDAKNTNLAKFLNNLESRIYATLSQKIAEELFKDNGATSGAFVFEFGDHRESLHSSAPQGRSIQGKTRQRVKKKGDGEAEGKRFNAPARPGQRGDARAKLPGRCNL